MLDLLKINNFALIEEGELEFSPYFNVLTGESGAGKSIIIGALELLMGGRATKELIRHGATRAEVTGVFIVPDYLNEKIANLFEDNDLIFEDDKQIQFRRVITQNSVRNYINDTAVSAKLLKIVSEQLVDFHGANDQLSLLIPARQLDLLDRYANSEELLNSCKKIFIELSDLREKYANFMKNIPDEAERERLALIIEDIKKVNPTENEDVELSSRYQLAAGAKEIIENTNAMQSILLDSENSVSEQLSVIYRKLQELSKIEENLISPLSEECAILQENLVSFSDKLNTLSEKVELDAEELQNMEIRLSELYTLKRRYGPNLEQVFETLKNAELRVNEYRQTSDIQQKFAKQEKELVNKLSQVAKELSSKRKNTAEKFSNDVKKKLNAIGFPKCCLEISFLEISPTINGCDKIEMNFSANSGEELRPLRKIASSGELSRLMLALKSVLANADSIPVIIFDEIDVNIGGETANAVGKELQNLGKSRQILAISHLGQVAARANRHFKVEKYEENNRTISKSLQLDAQSRVNEIARMIGGGKGSIEHASEIIKSAINN